jgi:hypothetical protein
MQVYAGGQGRTLEVLNKLMHGIWPLQKVELKNVENVNN